MIDDIDVVLWEPLKNNGENGFFDYWPYGDSSSPNVYPDAGMASEYFPLAERYLTMEHPPVAWLWYFFAIPLDTDRDMQPHMPTDWQIWAGPYNQTDLSIAYDVYERIIHGVPPLEFCWYNESWESQFSTNLLEILNESGDETEYDEWWTKYDITRNLIGTPSSFCYRVPTSKAFPWNSEQNVIQQIPMISHLKW